MTDNNVIVFKDNELELEVNVAPEEDTVWLTQAQMVKLFQSSKANISEHIKNIYDSGELYKEETVRNFRTVAAGSSSPSLKMLLMCSLIDDLAT